MSFRDRIVELRRVKASTLKTNSRNWRLHPEGQRSALMAVLEDIGIVGALVARKHGKSYELLDGHLRADIAQDEMLPVLVVDLNDEEAAKMLMTFDPLTDLAIPDGELFRELMDSVPPDDNADLRHMLAAINDKFERDEDASADADDEPQEVEGMALQPHEHYDFLVVLARTTQEWNVLCDRLGLEPMRRRSRLGTARAIKASALLDLLPVPTKRKGKR